MSPQLHRLSHEFMVTKIEFYVEGCTSRNVLSSPQIVPNVLSGQKSRAGKGYGPKVGLKQTPSCGNIFWD